MIRLLPREEEFFTLFVEVANRSHEAAGYLAQLFANGADKRTYWAESIKRLEREADDFTHEVVNRLDRTFITPIDREDIHLLASDLDDVIDRIDALARRAQISRLGDPPKGIVQLTDLLQKLTGELAQAVGKLKGNGKVIAHCIEVKRIEEQADIVYHEQLGRLFDTEKDPITLIKWKEIFDGLEGAIDEGEDVANDLQSIVLKHA